MKLLPLETRLLCHFMENVYGGHAPLKDFTDEGVKKLTEILTIKMADHLIPELKGVDRDDLIEQKVCEIIKVHNEFKRIKSLQESKKRKKSLQSPK
jgi:hypothetical protein